MVRQQCPFDKQIVFSQAKLFDTNSCIHSGNVELMITSHQIHTSHNVDSMLAVLKSPFEKKLKSVGLWPDQLDRVLYSLAFAIEEMRERDEHLLLIIQK